MNTTKPHPTEWPNKPWSAPPCPNDGPDGQACVMVAHTVRQGVRVHAAQQGKPAQWVTWETVEPKIARKGDGPWHIYPPERHGTTTCGRRIGQYVSTWIIPMVRLPEGESLCPVCVRHHQAGTFRSVGR